MPLIILITRLVTETSCGVKGRRRRRSQRKRVNRSPNAPKTVSLGQAIKKGGVPPKGPEPSPLVKGISVPDGPNSLASKQRGTPQVFADVKKKVESGLLPRSFVYMELRRFFTPYKDGQDTIYAAGEYLPSHYINLLNSLPSSLASESSDFVHSPLLEKIIGYSSLSQSRDEYGPSLLARVENEVHENRELAKSNPAYLVDLISSLLTLARAYDENGQSQQRHDTLQEVERAYQELLNKNLLLTLSDMKRAWKLSEPTYENLMRAEIGVAFELVKKSAVQLRLSGFDSNSIKEIKEALATRNLSLAEP